MPEDNVTHISKAMTPVQLKNRLTTGLSELFANMTTAIVEDPDKFGPTEEAGEDQVLLACLKDLGNMLAGQIASEHYAMTCIGVSARLASMAMYYEGEWIA